VLVLAPVRHGRAGSVDLPGRRDRKELWRKAHKLADFPPRWKQRIPAGGEYGNANAAPSAMVRTGSGVLRNGNRSRAMTWTKAPLGRVV